MTEKGSIARRQDITQRDLDDGSVLYDSKSGKAYTLNFTASLFWSYLDGNAAPEDIAAEISSIGGVERDIVMKHLQGAIEFFRENGLLSVCEA